MQNSKNCQKKPTIPCVMVIFGLTGDLTKRLLFPAICNLGAAGLLDSNFRVVGLGSNDLTTEAVRDMFTQNIKQFVVDPAAQNFGTSLVQSIEYLHGDFSDAVIFAQLKKLLDDLFTQKKASQNALFYLAVPPTFFGSITTSLGQAGLLDEKDKAFFRRVVIEKPFGRDLASAQQLNQTLLAAAKEEQLFRIDHFLGKETVQNIMAFRFANGIFDPIWNRNYIDSVQITAAETLGVESRGRYYDNTGALRDMIPNHIFQVLSLVAMESPVSFSSDDIQSEKEKVLHAIERYEPEQVLKYAVRGQYGDGMIDQESVIDYRSESNVAPNSATETYVALQLNIDNWRWMGVPFYIRTGKRMQRRATEVIIRFKSAPSSLFKDTPGHTISSNLLRLHLQPNEGISMRFEAKVPGPQMKLGDVDMSFQYKDYFGTACATGYETLLYDCINGDHTLFPRAGMMEAGWEIVQPVLDLLGALAPRDFPNYAAGSWGPKEADDLLAETGREWIL